MGFDELIERRGTHSQKWDEMEAGYGVPAETGIPMWVADMDFRPPASVQRALERMLETGVYGYYGADQSYREAICWWMRARHGWEIEPGWILTVNGLVNGTALAIDAFSNSGEAVAIMSPVYHAFARVTHASGRRLAELPLLDENGRYVLDVEAWSARMQGDERILILCSPHNPGGRVWELEELKAIAGFAEKHDLLVVSDEIHHDLVYPGKKHIPMARACPELETRLITLTAATKSFNIAGCHTGNVIISDAELRARFQRRLKALGISGNSFGYEMVEAAYSQEGAIWMDELMMYLDGNRKLFDDCIASIQGLRSMKLEATYLAWVDFSGTGMAEAEVNRRVAEHAKIAASSGPSFGLGGESHLRFNLALPRPLLKKACERLADAFSDLAG